MNVHVVIPAYKEAETIGSVLLALCRVTRSLRVSVVCDYPGDETYDGVEAVRDSLTYPVAKLVNRYEPGPLNAIKTGLQATLPDEMAVVVMADGCDDVSLIDAMAQQIEAGCDVVCASRYMRGGKQIGGIWVKKLLSRGAGVSFHWLTGIHTHDLTNSFKMYSPRTLELVDIESIGGFEVGMEITIKAFRRGLRITELPTIWTDRKAGQSRFRFRRWVPQYIRWYWAGVVGANLAPRNGQR